MVLVDRTSFVIGRVVAIAENTAYCTRPVLAVAIESQMIPGAFEKNVQNDGRDL
jgi:galactokinase